MQGWRKRQEDAHISAVSQGEKKDIDVFGVFDGHGGKEISKFVSNHFVQELTVNKNLSTDMSLALKETFIKMDEIMVTPESIEEIKKYARQSKEEDELQSKNEPPNSQMQLISQLIGPKDPESNEISMRTGCTACVMSIDETKKKLYFANAGDSRVVMCKKGVAEPMSEDHKPEMESEKTRIYKADGWISDGRVKGNLNLTRGFGDLEYKQNKNLKPEEQMITANPDIKVVDFTNDIDFVIIGCDGIWDCLKNQEACDFVSKKLKDNPEIQISKIVEDMLDTIVAKDLYNETGVGCDNMTCVVIVFKKGNVKETEKRKETEKGNEKEKEKEKEK
jgi:serine/threonine protein phosphatase PrpC